MEFHVNRNLVVGGESVIERNKATNVHHCLFEWGYYINFPKYTSIL